MRVVKQWSPLPDLEIEGEQLEKSYPLLRQWYDGPGRKPVVVA